MFRMRKALMPHQNPDEDISLPLDLTDPNIDDNTDDSDNSDSEPDTLNVDPIDENNVDEPPVQAGRATLSSRFADAYKAANDLPTGPNNKAYGEFLNKGVPNRDDYKPGKLNRLAAILGGASAGYKQGPAMGAKFANDMLDSKYNEALAQNDMQGKRLQQGAALEDKETGRKASFARIAATDITNQQKEETAAKNASSLALLRNAQAYKAMHPNAVYKTVNGKVRAYDGADPSKYIELGDAGVLSSDALKQKREYATFVNNLTTGRETTLEGIRQAGANARTAATTNAAGARQENTINAQTLLQELRAKQAKELEEFKIAHPTVTTTEEVVDPKANTRDTTRTTSRAGSKSVKMVDKDGKEWDVAPEDIANFKRENGIK